MQCRSVFGAIWIACGLIASVLIIPAGAAQRPFTDWTDAEKEAFLLNAEIVEQEPIGIGITGAIRCTLDDGSVRHDAQIQTIYEQEARKQFENGRTELNFTDFYTYNIAAYRLDRLIGLNMTPVAVPRRVDRQDAALVWWEDDILMMEGDRYTEEIQPPRPIEWVAQVGNQNIFQQLIYNTDPNMGNMLITNDWKLWIVDFTRAFRTNKDLRVPEDLPNSAPRHLYDGLKTLTKDTLEETMGDLLTGSQIEAILARRDLIVEHFDSLIESRGEGVVLRGE